MAVVETTDTDFAQKVKNEDKVIVKYYAGWCGSCRLFAPKFKRLSGDDRYEGVAFLDVNAENNPEARKAAGVTNLPSFAIYKNGEHLETISTSKEDMVVEMLNKLN